MKQHSNKGNFTNRKLLSTHCLADNYNEEMVNSRNIALREYVIEDHNNCGLIINSLTTLSNSIDNNNLKLNFEEIDKKCCGVTKIVDKLIKIILSENEMKETFVISEGFSLIISRMKKLEEQNNYLIQLTQKYQKDFQEITTENKQLKERYQYLSETNKEYCNMNNKLKFDIQERKNKSSNSLDDNMLMNYELEIRKLKRNFEEEKSSLVVIIGNYKKERESLLKEYSRIVHSYKEREKELMSKIKEYQYKLSSYSKVEKSPISKYRSLSSSIDKLLHVNGNLSTKHSKSNDYNKSITSSSIFE